MGRLLSRAASLVPAPRPGQALLEAAFAFTLLLMVLVALVQFALYRYAQNVVMGAAQDGARVAAGEGASPGEGEERAWNLLIAGLGSSADSIEVRAWEDPQAQTVTVEARGRLRTMIPWVNDSTLPLLAEATMSKEQFRPGGIVR